MTPKEIGYFSQDDNFHKFILLHVVISVFKSEPRTPRTMAQFARLDVVIEMVCSIKKVVIVLLICSE